MMLTVEYLTGLLSQIDSLTKELKDSESDNASLHRQLDHWQEISVHWENARDVLVDERDELTLIVERVTADMRALAAERDELRAALYAYASEFSLNEEGQSDVGSIHQNIRALKAAAKLALDALYEAQTADDGMAKWDRNKSAITALRQAGVQ